MLDGLRQFIADVVSPSHEPGTLDNTGYRLAATALLVHVVSLDGEPSEKEKRKLHGLIESSFGLDRGAADKLIASATLVEGEAVDLYHFTSVIMRSVDVPWLPAHRRDDVGIGICRRPGERVRGQCGLARRGSSGRVLARSDRSALRRRQAGRAGFRQLTAVTIASR